MPAVLTLSGWVLFAGRLAGLGLAAVLLCDAVARLGLGPLAMWRVRPRGGLADFGLGLLLGWALLGVLWLGLGLAGLYVPGVIGAAGLAALAGSRSTWRLRSPLAAALVEARALGWGAAATALCVFAMLAGLLCIPEFEMDCAYYHFGISWQWLQVHRVLLDWVPFTNHVPLPVEMIYVLPIMLGEDRLAKWMTASFFLAAAAVWASYCLRSKERKDAGWLGPLLALTGSTILWLVTASKNDVPAGGWLVAGAVVWAAGASSLGALLLGCGLAAKYTAGPLAIAWLLVHLPARRRIVPTAVLLTVPVLPWLAKAWLATGNPLYPLGGRWFPSLNWTGANEVAFLDYANRLSDPLTRGLWTFPGAFLASLRHDHLFVCLALPALLLIGRRRRAAWGIVGGLVVILAAGHFARFMLPGLWLLAFLAADELAALAPGWRRLAVPAAALMALASIAGSYQLRWFDQAKAFRPVRPVWREFITTRGEIIDMLETMPRLPGRPLKVLCSGEGRTWLLPVRVVYGGVQGETPLLWRIVKDSVTHEDIRRRLRQLGCPYLLHNFVSAEWLNERYRAFPWDARMARLYMGYCLRHLVIETAPQRSDYGNGGYYLFRLLPRPLPRPQPWLFYLPGTESLFGPVTTLENLNRPDDALAVSRRLAGLLPELGHAWNEVGHFLTVKGDTKGGFQALLPFVQRGMLDGMNVGECGANAVRVRAFALGSRLLARTLMNQPDHRNVVYVNLAFLWVIEAVDALNGRRMDLAASLADRAWWALSQMPPGTPMSAAQARARQETASLVWALRGELARARGRAAEAAEAFRMAWQTTPDMGLSPRWKELAETLAPKLFGMQ